MVSIKTPRKPKDFTRCLAFVSAFLVSEWDYNLNLITPDDISYGSTFKVWWVCSICKHNWKTSVNNRFIKGSNCPKCAIKSRSSIRRLSIDFVKQEAYKIGFWEVLSEEYVSAKSKLLCKCLKCGRIHKISWEKIRKSQGCYDCYLQGLSDTKKGTPPWSAIYAKVPTLAFIKNDFLTQGYTLISNNYNGSDKHLVYTCTKGHRHSMSWDNWKQGKRCPTCKIINMSGSNHPQWLGGKSFEPYCAIWKDTDYKESIKIRDNYVCQNPYCFKTDNVLNIHHIDYDKKNCHPSNLVTVCRSCNAKANKDRQWHVVWYQTIMTKKFGYNY